MTENKDKLGDKDKEKKDEVELSKDHAKDKDHQTQAVTKDSHHSNQLHPPPTLGAQQQPSADR